MNMSKPEGVGKGMSGVPGPLFPKDEATVREPHGGFKNPSLRPKTRKSQERMGGGLEGEVLLQKGSPSPSKS